MKNAAPKAGQKPSEPYTFVIVKEDAKTDFVKFQGYKIGKVNPVSMPVTIAEALEKNERLAPLVKFL